jgi:ElaB/YqjD/DUF883 family membrane-anchored ribosome-binding protein
MNTVAEHGNGATGARADEALRQRAGQLHKFLDDVEELLRRMSSGSGDDPDIARLRSRVEASLERTKAGVRDGTRAAIDGTRRAALATDEYVHRRPWVAIGASAAAGMLVGALLRGRTRD